jgi:hypothetical protein
MDVGMMRAGMMQRDDAMKIHRAAIRTAFVLGAILAADVAGAADTKDYCILGVGDGLSWSWEVRFFSSTAVEIDRCTGTATAPVSASSDEIRDVLMAEINDGCGIVVTAETYPGCSGLTVDGYFDFELWLEEKVASPPGPLLEVTSTPFQFNPFIAVPEPSRGMSLGAGVLVLLALARGSTRSERRDRTHPLPDPTGIE